MFTLYTVEPRSHGVDTNGYVKPLYNPIVYHPCIGAEQANEILTKSGRRAITVVYDVTNPQDLLSEGSCVPADIARSVIERLKYHETPVEPAPKSPAFDNFHVCLRYILSYCFTEDTRPKGYWLPDVVTYTYDEDMHITLIAAINHPPRNNSLFRSDCAIIDCQTNIVRKYPGNTFIFSDNVLIISKPEFIKAVVDRVDGYINSSIRGVVANNGDVLSGRSPDKNDSLFVIC